VNGTALPLAVDDLLISFLAAENVSVQLTAAFAVVMEVQKDMHNWEGPVLPDPESDVMLASESVKVEYTISEPELRALSRLKRTMVFTAFAEGFANAAAISPSKVAVEEMHTVAGPVFPESRALGVRRLPDVVTLSVVYAIIQATEADLAGVSALLHVPQPAPANSSGTPAVAPTPAPSAGNATGNTSGVIPAGYAVLANAVIAAVFDLTGVQCRAD
jgi:hypothetical protein